MPRPENGRATPCAVCKKIDWFSHVSRHTTCWGAVEASQDEGPHDLTSTGSATVERRADQTEVSCRVRAKNMNETRTGGLFTVDDHGSPRTVMSHIAFSESVLMAGFTQASFFSPTRVTMVSSSALNP